MHNLARRIKWLARAVRTGIRRNLRQLALALLVGLSVGEPLLCIVHCQIWLPSMLGQHMAAMHHHHMAGMDMSNMDMAGMSMPNMAMNMSGMDMAGMSMPGAAMNSASAAPDTSACHFRGATESDMPFHIQPSPVHELLATFAIALLLLLLIRQLPAAIAGHPPDPFISPPFQPPRPFGIQTLVRM